MAIGTVLGGMAGLFGGLVDQLIMRGTDTLMSIPSLLLIIVFVTAIGAFAAWIGWNEGLLRLREIAAALRLRSAGYISTLIRRGDAELASNESLQELARQAIAALQLA